MSRSAPKICPYHNKLMVRTEFKDGPRWDCPVPGCTVVCWSGQTSTPANFETRQARRRAHTAFDGLWKGHWSGPAKTRSKVTAVMSRKDAFAWLVAAMDVEQKYAHIGMANEAQCNAIIAAVSDLREESRQERNVIR